VTTALAARGSRPLDGRVAVITGGGGGIGCATAVALAGAGARVVLVGRSAERLLAAAGSVRAAAGGDAPLTLPLDVGEEDDMAAMAAATLARFGRIDLLVCCAGIALGAGRRGRIPYPVAQLAADEWDEVLRTNLRGTFLANRAVLPAMAAAGRGSIVNLSSSPGGIRGQPFAAAYCASKFAVAGLTESLADEARAEGVRVHVLYPELVDTPLVRDTTLAARFGAPLPPERVAALVLFLAALPEDATLLSSARLGHPTLRRAWAPSTVPRTERAERAASGPAPRTPENWAMDDVAREGGGRLAGRVAIVTGAASGIGGATAARLLAEGARLVAVDRDGARLDDAVRVLGDALAGDDPAGRIEALALDVRREADMEEMARRAVERFGRIDLLVACAGLLRPAGTAPKPLAQMALAEWDEVIETNLRGVFLSNRAVLPHMIRQRGGQIVNLSSTSGRQGRALDSAYCASKFGVIGLSEALGQEVDRYGVRVQVVLPDAVDTPLWRQNGPIPPPRERLPADRVADLILFLVTLPEDTVLVAPVIAPFRARGAARAPGRTDAVSEVVSEVVS
jgi:NAD(P)-dependent dehydrogenase (short-subunit alcohol dehydrogenase family)